MHQNQYTIIHCNTLIHYYVHQWYHKNTQTHTHTHNPPSFQANFEKFLVDGRTGKPLRRYPRKYQPYDIADDISALIQGKPLPPAGSNFKEEWRNAAKEAENDTYRFQKGLNYFDQ